MNIKITFDKKRKDKGQAPYLVTLTLDGRRKRKFCKSRPQAHEYRRLLIKNIQEGNPVGKNVGAIRLLDALSLVLVNMKERNCRPDSIKGMSQCISHFSKNYGNIKISAITADIIRNYLQNYNAGTSRNSIRCRMDMFFKFCLKKNLLKFSPIPPPEYIHLDEKSIDILSVKETRDWMEECRSWSVRPRTYEAGRRRGRRHKGNGVRSCCSGNGFQPYDSVFALMFFAGIRPKEVSRMRWELIHHDRQTIEIPGEIAKTRKTRHLKDLPKNLWTWLPAGRQGKIVSSYAAVKEFRKRMRVRNPNLRWSHDVARHSFCTYGYWRGIEWAMRISGHRNFSTFIRHYVDPRSVTPEDTEEYFSII